MLEPTYDDAGLDQLELDCADGKQLAWSLLTALRQYRNSFRQNDMIAESIAALPADASRRDINVTIYRAAAKFARGAADGAQRRLEAALAREAAAPPKAEVMINATLLALREASCDVREATTVAKITAWLRARAVEERMVN